MGTRVFFVIINYLLYKLSCKDKLPYFLSYGVNFASHWIHGPKPQAWNALQVRVNQERPCWRRQPCWKAIQTPVASHHVGLLIDPWAASTPAALGHDRHQGRKFSGRVSPGRWCVLCYWFQMCHSEGFLRPHSMQAAAIFHVNVFSGCLSFFPSVKLAGRETTLRQGLNCFDSSLSHLDGALLEQWI